LFNTAGRVVRRLYDGPIAPGAQNLLWDGRDAGGRPLPAGVYLARVTAGRETQVTKFTLVR
jgi:flagellar hook assembly protein FlgD